MKFLILCSVHNFFFYFRLIEFIEDMLNKDISDNEAIGANGAKAFLELNPGVSNLNILTHCNTGSLATAGYGTALGVIRSLKKMNNIGKCIT